MIDLTNSLKRIKNFQFLSVPVVANQHAGSVVVESPRESRPSFCDWAAGWAKFAGSVGGILPGKICRVFSNRRQW